MFERELEAAVAMAKRAGAAILRHYEGNIVAESKVGIDRFEEPVTAADREASRLVVEDIARLFPRDAVLSEEESDDIAARLRNDRVWIVDPIDGTAGFIKRDGDFAVQIGLAENGLPVIGVVYLPFHNVVYYAARGAGAFSARAESGPVRLSVSGTLDLNEMTVAVSRNHRSPRMSRIIEEVGFRGEVERGSVGLKIGLVAERTCDIYIHLSPRTKLWDICAPQIILEESGGRLTDLFGTAYRYDIGDVQNWGGIVASNGVIHDRVISRLEPLLREFGRDRIRPSARAGDSSIQA